MHFGFPQFNTGMSTYGYSRPSYYSGFHPAYQQQYGYQPSFRGWQPQFRPNTSQ